VRYIIQITIEADGMGKAAYEAANVADFIREGGIVTVISAGVEAVEDEEKPIHRENDE
jgi:hypothetical protein